MSAGRDEITNNNINAMAAAVNVTRDDSEYRDLLLAIKSASEKLAYEITGGTASRDDERIGLAENNSLKQVQEEILYQMRTMNANIQAQSTKLEEISLKIQEITNNSKVKADLKESAKRIAEFPVVEIRFPTKVSWNSFWPGEIIKLQKNIRILTDGFSLMGKTLGQIAESVPRPVGNNREGKIRTMASSILVEISMSTEEALELAQAEATKIITTRERNRKPVLVEFCNHLDFPLQRPQLFVQRGFLLQDMPRIVIPGAREVTCFYSVEPHNSDINDEGIQGLCSYQLHTQEFSLVVRLEYYLSTLYSTKFGLNWGLAFVPTNVPIDVTMFAKEVPALSAQEFNFDTVGDVGLKVVQSKSLMAVSTCADENSYVLLRIQVLKNMQKPSVPLEMKSVSDGYTIPKPPFDHWESVYGEKVGCVVEIENRLTVSLVDFQWHIDTASQYALLPTQIASFTREMFYVLGDIFHSSTKGMISYKIDNTDLRMAMAFWTRPPSQNQFAVGFIPSCSTTDAAIMNSLINSEQWKTRPYIFACANEGEQILEYRNFRITASMTEDLKAILKIVITAF